MTLVRNSAPEPHQKYVVVRDENPFIATPCYGLHLPWWVPTTPDGESRPIEMLGGDEWTLLDQSMGGK